MSNVQPNTNNIIDRIGELYDPNWMATSNDDIIDLDADEPVNDYRNHTDLIIRRDQNRQQRAHVRSETIERNKILEQLNKEAEKKKIEEREKLEQLDKELRAKHTSAVDYLEL
jgi:hypothetical protein